MGKGGGVKKERLKEKRKRESTLSQDLHASDSTPRYIIRVGVSESDETEKGKRKKEEKKRPAPLETNVFVKKTHYHLRKKMFFGAERRGEGRGLGVTR